MSNANYFLFALQVNNFVHLPKPLHIYSAKISYAYERNLRDFT